VFVSVKTGELDVPIEVVQSVEFWNIDQFSEALTTLGYSIYSKQLDAGDMTTKIAIATCGGIRLLRQRSNRCVETVGTYSTQCITLVMPRHGTSLFHNGYAVQDTQMLVVDAGAETFASNPNTDEVMSILIPKFLFIQTMGNLVPQFVPQQQPCMLLSFSDAFTKQMRQLITLCTQPLQSCFVQKENEGNLLSGIAFALSDTHALKDDKITSKKQSKFRMLMKARCYIEQHIAVPITMYDLCQHTGASLSSIERVFRELLQVTPSHYILAQRLSGVRAGVLTLPAVSISDLALQHGFNHLGRFSSAYKSQFGCLPSEERSHVNYT